MGDYIDVPLHEGKVAMALFVGNMLTVEEMTKMYEVDKPALGWDMVGDVISPTLSELVAPQERAHVVDGIVW